MAHSPVGRVVHLCFQHILVEEQIEEMAGQCSLFLVSACLCECLTQISH